MPVSSREIVLSRYGYDPLDRQTDCMLLSLPAILRFYRKSRLATEIQGALQTSVFQHDDQLLAQRRQQDGKVDTTLLVTDQQRSVLGARGLTGSHLLAYTPYGHRPAENGLLSLLGFNGERPDPVTGHYHLGNGYRQFNPVLMRFNCPDSLSPFGEGGVNAYAYCGGEPVSRSDPTGHTWGPIKVFLRKIGVMKKPVVPGNTVQIGAWTQVQNNPEWVQPSSSIVSKQKAIKPARLTEKEVQRFREELNQAVKEGQESNRNGFNGTNQRSARSPNRPQNNSNITSNDSVLSDDVEHMSSQALTQLKQTVTAWPNVGTERSNILNAVTSETRIRALNVYQKPPINNRNIRRDEPGYFSS